MGFDFQWFNKNKTKATNATESRMRNMDKRFDLTDPCLRGFANKWFKQPALAEKWYQDLASKVLSSLDGSLRTWEEFQSTQKGPTRPLSSKAYWSSLENISSDSFDIDRSSLDFIYTTLSRYFHDTKIDVYSVDFAEAWKRLPNSTFRGFPYHSKGISVDDQIISEFGNTFETAKKKFLEAPMHLFYPGFRIQGKPVKDGPKLRFVFMPTINYQYLINGLVDETMNHLKKFPNFCGWQKPDERKDTMRSLLNRAEAKGYSLISLDFSRFDQHIHPIFRDYAAKFTLDYFKMKEKDYTDLMDHYAKINRNQFLRTWTKQGVQPIPVNNLLGSGMKDTQQSGSFINLMVQCYVFMKLYPNDPIPVDLMLCLGDDVVFPVKGTHLTLDEYHSLLSSIKREASKIGFITHDKKAYPTPEVTFLQKLYSGDIFYQGTILRTLASMIYREKNQKKVVGVTSIPTLELIGQISMTNEMFGYGNENENSMIREVVKAWLDQDKLLRWYAQKFDVSQVNEFFKFIVKSCTEDLDAIFDYLDIQSYDHNFTKDLFYSNDYGLTFPVLPIILEEVKHFKEVPDSQVRSLISVESKYTELDDQLLGEGE